MQVLHFKPVVSSLVLQVDSVTTVRWHSIMHYVSNQIVYPRTLAIVRREFAEIQLFEWEVDYRGIFLCVEYVLSEPLDVEDQVRGQLGYLETSESGLFICSVLFLRLSVEFRQELAQCHLQMKMMLNKNNL